MINKLNLDLFNFFNQFAEMSTFTDRIIIILANWTVLIFIASLIFFWFHKLNKKRLALYGVYSAIAGMLINLLIGLVYYHPRPFLEHLGTQLIEHSASGSFPSNHTTFMLAIALMFIYFKETRKTGIVLTVLGLFSGFARVSAGVHFPFDIFGSIIVALISSFVVFKLKSQLDGLNDKIISIYYYFLELRFKW